MILAPPILRAGAFFLFKPWANSPPPFKTWAPSFSWLEPVSSQRSHLPSSWPEHLLRHEFSPSPHDVRTSPASHDLRTPPPFLFKYSEQWAPNLLMTWTPPSFPHNLITFLSSWLEYLILLLNTITKFLPIFDIQVLGNSGPSFRRAGSWGSILCWKRDLIPKRGIMELFLIVGNMITFSREGSRGSFQLWEDDHFPKWGIMCLFSTLGTG